MSAELFVFDFDGTLVDTAAAKRQAFFDVFPQDCGETVERVLTEDPDGSRFAVIPRMIIESGRSDLNPDAIITAFGKQVLHRVALANEIPGASDALKWAASKGAAYVFSVTPHEDLRAALTQRGWVDILSGIYGFPNHKPEVLKRLMNENHTAPQNTTVIGDGISDAEAARMNGCHYLPAMPGWPQKLMQESIE